MDGAGGTIADLENGYGVTAWARRAAVEKRRESMVGVEENRT
jgi:hypothetical protein